MWRARPVRPNAEAESRDLATRDLQRAVAGSDFIVPARHCRRCARSCGNAAGVKRGAIVTDVGSVKASVVREIESPISGAARILSAAIRGCLGKTGAAARALICSRRRLRRHLTRKSTVPRCGSNVSGKPSAAGGRLSPACTTCWSAGPVIAVRVAATLASVVLIRGSRNSSPIFAPMVFATPPAWRPVPRNVA